MLNGVSGNESAVREFIETQIKDYCRIETDNAGNLIAFKKGARTPEKRVMFAAHMDEVGFIVTSVTDDGYIKIAPVGGIDARVMLGTRILFENGVRGVVSAVPVHLLKGDEREKIPDFSDMAVDIGAGSRETAEQAVQQGMAASFDSTYEEFGQLVKARAIDDRFGCLALINLIKCELPFDTFFVFTVQEEVGLRGACCAAYKVEPDIAVVVETTTAADVNGVSGADRVCCLGDGPVVSYMDGRTIYSRRLYNLAFEAARESGLKVQTKSKIAGGNDAGAIQRAGSGSEVLAVSLPCRYIHSPSCTVNKDDMESMEALLKKLCEKLDGIV